jgi:hypothetical protein
MPVSVWNGTGWAPAKSIPVWNGAAWANAKKIRVWNGSAWVLAWVPPVTNAALTLSKVGVATDETYSVTLTAPGGFPEGAVVTIRSNVSSTPIGPEEGSTQVAVTASHATAQTVTWYADVVTAGGTTTFGPVTQTVTVPAPTYVTLNGGTHVELEAKMREAASHPSKTLRLTGTFHLYGNAEIQAGITIIATGAKFNCNRNLGAYSKPGDAHQPGKFINENGSGLGGYDHAGWFVWDGGEFDGNGEGCFTISHSPGFTIKNATFYRYCADQDYFSWGDGHAIEVNSSGGPDNKSGLNGTFNVLIQGCTFLGTDMGQRAWGNDEPVQYDWSWDGSGGRAPYDGTMTHNMRVTGCTFHRYSEGATASGEGGDVGKWTNWQWRFAICAIGAHNPGSTLRPTERHNHLQFDNNAIHGADGYRGSLLAFDKGAIHSHAARQVWVVNNQFYGCGGGNGGYQVTAQDATDVTYNETPSGNTSNNGGHPNEWRVANG